MGELLALTQIVYLVSTKSIELLGEADQKRIRSGKAVPLS